jgi:MFS family permease
MLAGTTHISGLPDLFLERPALRRFIVIRSLDELATQMVNVAVGWRVYAATHDPMSLAYIGLAQFASTFALTLLGGEVSDRFDRRRVITFALVAQSLCLALFAIWSITATRSVAPVYVLLILTGAARAFLSPAMSATLPHVARGEAFPRAVAAASSAFQVCAILGPAIGGLLYAASGSGAFIAATALCLFAATQSLGLPTGRFAASDAERIAGDQSLFAGVRAILSNRTLFALISLDLFAVLFGGVAALLPIYAQDILAVGPFGLGCLRSAPGIGSALIGLFLTHRAVTRDAGKLMLIAVAGFGFSTVVFALSANFWLSLAALAAVGGFDMVSMVIRQTLIQIATPDAMRGRVSAVNWVFIGASAELGDFESGLAASLLGAASAALFGGVATLVVVALWAALYPELRRAETMT